ncbi:MAG: hypothetical protein KDD66_04045 [Bdellovibrionales bacterium]|nr:hypothetical protein [Bdellovibrionales bacterium]
MSLEQTESQSNGSERALWWGMQLIFIIVGGFFFKVIYEVSIDFDADFYQRHILFINAVMRQKFLNCSLIMLLPFIVFFRRLSWQCSGEERILRIFAFSSALLIAWQLATLDYNYYYDTWHGWDRLLIIGAAIGVWFHPVCLPLLILQSYLYSRQLNYPLGGFDWTDKQIFLDLLIYAQLGLLLRIFVRVRAATILYMLVLIFNANYFFAGVQKLQLSPSGYEWVTENQVVNLVLASYHNGWLRSADGPVLSWLLDFAAAYPILLTLPTILIEVGSALVFLNSRLFRTIMLLHVLLHAVIMLSSGVFFWKWSILNIVLYLLVLPSRVGQLREMFSRRAFYTSLPLFMLCPLLFAPVPLGWFDTTYVPIVRAYAVDDDGAEAELEGFYFGPYNILFQQSRFYYLSHSNYIVGTYGGTDNYFLFKKLQEELSAAEVRSLQSRVGRPVYNQSSREAFEGFIRRFVSNANRAAAGGKAPALPQIFSAPYHIYSFAVGKKYDGHGPVGSVRVRSLIFFRDQLLEDVPLIEVDIQKENDGTGG